MNLKERKIIIPATQMKGKRPHEVPIHKNLAEFLKSVIQSYERVNPKELVIGSQVVSMKTSFRSALNRAKIPTIRWHDLRHTFTSWMATRCSYAVLEQLTSHAQPKTVTLRYTHIPFEELSKAIDRLPNLIGRMGSESNATRDIIHG